MLVAVKLIIRSSVKHCNTTDMVNTVQRCILYSYIMVVGLHEIEWNTSTSSSSSSTYNRQRETTLVISSGAAQKKPGI